MAARSAPSAQASRVSLKTRTRGLYQHMSTKNSTRMLTNGYDVQQRGSVEGAEKSRTYLRHAPCLGHGVHVIRASRTRYSECFIRRQYSRHKQSMKPGRIRKHCQVRPKLERGKWVFFALMAKRYLPQRFGIHVSQRENGDHSKTQASRKSVQHSEHHHATRVPYTSVWRRPVPQRSSEAAPCNRCSNQLCSIFRLSIAPTGSKRANAGGVPLGTAKQSAQRVSTASLYHPKDGLKGKCFEELVLISWHSWFSREKHGKTGLTS